MLQVGEEEEGEVEITRMMKMMVEAMMEVCGVWYVGVRIRENV